MRAARVHGVGRRPVADTAGGRRSRRPWRTGILLLAAACVGHADDPAAPGPASSDPPPAEAFGVPLYTDDLRALHETTRAELDRVARGRIEQLRRDIAGFRAQAEEDMAAGQRIGNVRAMMGARAGVVLIDRAANALAEEGDFEIPDDVRAEIRALVARWRESKASVDARAEEMRAGVLARRREAFAEHVRAGAEETPADDAVAPVFAAWIAADWQEVAAEPDPADPEVERQDRWRPPPVDGDDPKIAESAPAATWTPRAKVTLEMAGPDILRIPRARLRLGGEGAQRHPLGTGTSRWAVEVLEPWPEEEAPPLRLERLPDDERRPVQLVGWPSERNRWTLEVRDARAHAFPSAHGFILLTGETGPAPGEAPEAPDTPVPSSVPRVSIPVRTMPAGAAIHVNGRRFEQDGEPVLTPATLRLPPGTYAIRLSLPEHVDREVAGFRVEPGRVIEWRFQSERSLPGRTIRMDPRRGWTGSNVNARPGDRFLIVASGRWIIGSRGEPCGPEGYPDTPAFAHYYGGDGPPRQLDRAPYGALLVRVGVDPAARMAPVGSELRVQARTFGELMFDANELPGSEHRRDNRGNLDITIIPLPAAP